MIITNSLITILVIIRAICSVLIDELEYHKALFEFRDVIRVELSRAGK